METFINMVHDCLDRIRQEIISTKGDAINTFAGFVCADAIFDRENIEEQLTRALARQSIRSEECRAEILCRWLTFIRKVYWEIEHVKKVYKPKRHNKHLSWIATGTYYHYLSSDDEDSSHHYTVMRIHQINKNNNSTLKMVG